MKYILASSSPRRKAMLSIFNLEIESVEHLFDESSITYNGSPEKYCKNISIGKVNSIIKKYKQHTVISADTIVAIDDQILEKPRDKKEAAGMLESLSGKVHTVITGTTIMCKAKNINFSFTEKTQVKFNELDVDIIEYYVDRYQPLDKSGSYGIQDFSSIFVESIDGCFYNVAGLPLSKFFYHLRRLGLVRFSLNTSNRINKL